MNLDPKSYKVRIVPKLKKNTSEENGTEMKAIYVRTSAPGDAAIKEGFTKTKFFHLEIYAAGTGRLGGDVKPYTITVFENREKLLFDMLSEIESEDGHIVLENSKVKILKEALPGLKRTRPCSPYYATRMNSEGVEVKLMQSEKQPDGSFKKMPVVLEHVTYFLFENECNEENDNVKYANAVKAALKHAVTATAGGEDIVEKSKSEEDDGDEA